MTSDLVKVECEIDTTVRGVGTGADEHGCAVGVGGDLDRVERSWALQSCGC